MSEQHGEGRIERDPVPERRVVDEGREYDVPTDEQQDVIRTSSWADSRRATLYEPDLDRHVLPPDQIRWGPVFGGIFATIASMLALNILGLAIGLSIFNPDANEVTDLGTSAGLWSAGAGLIAFFIGGWLAGRSTSTRASVSGPFTGLANGSMVWATTLVFLLVLAAVGAGGLLGYFGASFDEIANALGFGDGVSATALTSVEQGAWGTFIALIATLVVAALGGLAGQASQPEVDDIRT